MHTALRPNAERHKRKRTRQGSWKSPNIKNRRGKGRTRRKRGGR